MKARKKLKDMKSCGLKPEILLGQQLNIQMVMKIKFILDDELPLIKKIEISSMIIALRAIFLEKKPKYYPQIFFGKGLCKI